MTLKRGEFREKRRKGNYGRQNEFYNKPDKSEINFSMPFLNLPFVLTIVLLVFLGIILYYFYINIPGVPEKIFFGLNKDLPDLENQTSNNHSQFYPNMKFNHNSISYSIDSLCNFQERSKMTEAFEIFSNYVELINFYEVSVNADIEVSCSDYQKQTPEGDYFIAGEGGAKEIIQTGRYHVINQGIILLNEESKEMYKCDWPNVELHELTHVFGFDHASQKNSLMYPVLTSCFQELDEEIIEKLKTLYSEENLAELYFENAEVIKKGIYLDFNLTIKNSGVVDAENVILSVLDENRLVKEFDLDDLKYGAGIKIEIQNLKLVHKNPDEIQFIIDKKNFIKELDEKNNILESNF